MSDDATSLDSCEEMVGAAAYRLLISPERQLSVGERGEHPAIPTGENLLVAGRPDSLRTDSVKLAFPARRDVGQLLERDAEVRGDTFRITRHIEDVVSFPVAPITEVVQRAENATFFFAENLHHLDTSPDVELPFFPLAIRVERGVETAFRRCHFPLDKSEDLVGDAGEKRILVPLPGSRVQACEQSVVVQHLFEMWNEPARIDGVTMKTAADLIVHPAVSHFCERVGDDLVELTIVRS